MLIARPLRRLLLAFVVSLAALIGIAFLAAWGVWLGSSDLAFTLPLVLTAGAVVAIIVGGAATFPQTNGPVVLRSHIAARVEGGRFGFAVVGVFFALLYFGLALSFTFTPMPFVLVALAVALPAGLLIVGSLRPAGSRPRNKTG